MPKQEFRSIVNLPGGHQQDWPLIEKVLREAERLTSQWPTADTEVEMRGENEFSATYPSLLDAKIDLGENLRDIYSTQIMRLDVRRGGTGQALFITFGGTQPDDESTVYVSGPIKSTCETMARRMQEFVLHLVEYPLETDRKETLDSILKHRLQHLHPTVRATADSRILSGHLDDAVEEACKGIGSRLRRLTGLDEDGCRLVTEALGEKARIRLNAGQTQTEKNEQKGLMYLGMALFLAARNPRAHRPADPDTSLDEVIEWLSVASAIHRALDSSSNSPAQRTPISAS